MTDSSNVIPLPTWEQNPRARDVFPLSFEQFCMIDVRADWIERVSVNGFTILQFPRAAVICSPCGSVVCNAIAGTDLSAIFDDEEEVWAAAG